MRTFPCFVLAAFLIGALGAAGTARAEPEAPVRESPPLASGVVAPAGSEAPHLRLGVAMGGTVGFADHDPATPVPVHVGVLNPTLHLDLGVQASRHLGIYVRGELGTSWFTYQAAAYLVGEWSPVRRFSIGTGLGWDGMASYCMDCREQSTWSAVSIPLIVGVDIVRGEHHALRVGVEGAAGFDPSTATFGWHTAVTVGWVWN